jgi:hypothetical protein
MRPSSRIRQYRAQAYRSAPASRAAAEPAVALALRSDCSALCEPGQQSGDQLREFLLLGRLQMVDQPLLMTQQPPGRILHHPVPMLGEFDEYSARPISGRQPHNQASPDRPVHPLRDRARRDQALGGQLPDRQPIRRPGSPRY